MQGNEKKIDSRSFAQIYSSLTPRSREKYLLTKALCDRLEVSRQTVYFWGKGYTQPHVSHSRILKTIAQTLEANLGIRVNENLLFPRY